MTVLTFNQNAFYRKSLLVPNLKIAHYCDISKRKFVDLEYCPFSIVYFVISDKCDIFAICDQSLSTISLQYSKMALAYVDMSSVIEAQVYKTKYFTIGSFPNAMQISNISTNASNENNNAFCDWNIKYHFLYLTMPISRLPTIISSIQRSVFYYCEWVFVSKTVLIVIWIYYCTK